MAQERKKRKVKNQRYSFEVKGELECWHWIELLNNTIANAFKEQNKTDAYSVPGSSKISGTLKASGGLTRTRSTSAPPTMEPLQRSPLGNKTKDAHWADDSDDDDPYADSWDDSHTDDEDSSELHKEKEAEPHGRRNTVTSVSFPSKPNTGTPIS